PCARPLLPRRPPQWGVLRRLPHGVRRLEPRSRARRDAGPGVGQPGRGAGHPRIPGTVPAAAAAVGMGPTVPVHFVACGLETNSPATTPLLTIGCAVRTDSLHSVHVTPPSAATP